MFHNPALAAGGPICPYPSGRSKEWLKTKCVLSDEFIIIGFAPSETKKGVLGALSDG